MTPTRTKRTGPQNSLVEADPRVVKIKKRLADAGYTTLSQAAMSVGFHPNVFIRILRDGLSGDPHKSTIDRLEKLGILDLVPRRNSA